jgi:5-methylthioadenosine/S-adenosylhomocysteine deaminase
MNTNFILKNIDICNFDGYQENKNLLISKNKFNNIVDSKLKKLNKTISFDLKDFMMTPALINSHDHLLGTWLPRVGNGPYLNWKPWDEDLKEAPLYVERSKVSNEDLYKLSFYRQILSGVTTVSDHIPPIVNKNFIKDSLIRIIDKYALAHEASSYDLKWGESLEKEIKKSKKMNIPFITHIEEGFDEEALVGVPNLHKKKGIFSNTVLVHCLSCSKEDIKLISKQNANFVWCPSSNIYMFNQTADIKTFLKEKVNTTLGTDSPMSGGVNLLKEMKFAQNIYKKTYNLKLSSREIFKMVTINAAKAFLLDDKLGEIKPGKLADFIITKKRKKIDPYDSIINLKTSNIELLVKEGKPLFGSKLFFKLIEKRQDEYQWVTIENKKYFLIGKPHELLKRIRKNVGFKKEFAFFPIH